MAVDLRMAVADDRSLDWRMLEHARTTTRKLHVPVALFDAVLDVDLVDDYNNHDQSRLDGALFEWIEAENRVWHAQLAIKDHLWKFCQHFNKYSCLGTEALDRQRRLSFSTFFLADIKTTLQQFANQFGWFAGEIAQERALLMDAVDDSELRQLWETSCPKHKLLVRVPKPTKELLQHLYEEPPSKKPRIDGGVVDDTQVR